MGRKPASALITQVLIFLMVTVTVSAHVSSVDPRDPDDNILCVCIYVSVHTHLYAHTCVY